MAVYLISYDLNKETVRPKIVDKIRDTFEGYARISESSYAVSTTRTVQQAYDVVKPLLDDNDNLYVITLRRPYIGYGPEDLNKWLENELPW